MCAMIPRRRRCAGPKTERNYHGREWRGGGPDYRDHEVDGPGLGRAKQQVGLEGLGSMDGLGRAKSRVEQEAGGWTRLEGSYRGRIGLGRAYYSCFGIWKLKDTIPFLTCCSSRFHVTVINILLQPPTNCELGMT